jgi:uroporphyrinogen decarboxylase
LLRGEIWITPEVLLAAGLKTNGEGLVEFSSSIGADLCFFHCSGPSSRSGLGEMVERATTTGLASALTVDGPFQRLAQKRGIMSLVEDLARNPLGLKSQLTQESETVAENLRWMTDTEAKLIILGEDIAYMSGLYFSPEVFRKLFLPLYRPLVDRCSSTGRILGWHSDGDVSTVLPDMVNCGFRFFSLEWECVDLLGFKRTYGARVTLIGGLRTDWLFLKEIGQEREQECRKDLRSLAQEGGLILSSSCGLFRSDFVPILKHIYRLVENLGDGSIEKEGL